MHEATYLSLPPMSTSSSETTVRFVNGAEVGEWKSLQNTFTKPTRELLIQTFDENVLRQGGKLAPT